MLVTRINRLGSQRAPCNGAPLLPFSGRFATLTAQTQLLNDHELKLTLEVEKNRLGRQATPYIGKTLPRGFFSPHLQNNPNALLREQSRILAQLNKVASTLSQLDIGLYRMAGFDYPFTLPPFHLKLGQQHTILHYLGSGNFGSAFKLVINIESYVFKVFYPRHSELLFSGPYNEAALGAYITAKNVRNMPHLFMANPQARWQLTEYIDKQFDNPHPQGPSWQDLNLQILDPQYNADNEKKDKHGLSHRIDYGHLTTTTRQRPILPDTVKTLFRTLDESHHVDKHAYWQLFKTHPEYRGLLLSNLGCLAPANRLPMLEHALAYPEVQDFPPQAFFSSQDFNRHRCFAFISPITQAP